MELHFYSPDEIKRDCLSCPAYNSCLQAVIDKIQVKCIFFCQLEKEVNEIADKWNSI